MSDEIFTPPDTSVEFGAKIVEMSRIQREEEEYQKILSLSAGERTDPQPPHTDEDEFERLAARRKSESGVNKDSDSSSSGFDTVKAVAADVAEGTLKAVPAVIEGVLENVADAASLVFDLADGLSEKLLEAGVSESTVAMLRADPESREAARAFLDEFQENDQNTVTGSVIRDMANFSAGFFFVLGRLRKARAIVGLAKKFGDRSAAVVANAISGAIAEFVTIDTAKEDLDLLLSENPTIRNPVLEFMAGSPDDTGLQQRTRAALIGAGLGVGVDAFLISAGALRGALRSKALLKRAEKRVVAEARAQGESIKQIEPPKITAEEANISGFAESKRLVRPAAARSARQIEKAEEQLAKDFPGLTPDELRAKASEIPSEIEINIDRLNVDDDIAQLMQDATDLDLSKVKSARRGVRTNVQTEAEANRLGIDLGDVLARRKGEALTAAQTTGYRRVWVAASTKVEELAKIARASKNDVDVFRFRKSLAVFNAINQSVLGARAESGRALQAWRITVSGDAERAAIMGQMVAASGGDRVGRGLAETFLDALASGQSAGQLNAIAQRGWFARTVDAVKESAILGLLWRPATHVANISVNAFRIGLSITEKGVAARIARESLTENSVIVGESYAQLRGTLGALRAVFVRSADAEALTALGPALRKASSSVASSLQIRTATNRASVSGAIKDIKKAGSAAKAVFPRSAEGDALAKATSESVAQTGSKIDIRLNSITAEGFGLDESSGLGKIVETVGNAVALPATGLRKADDFFKMVAYAGEVEGQAFRQATREGAEKGWSPRKIAERIEELTTNPPENIRLEAGNAALYSTFTQGNGAIGKLLLKSRDVVPPLAFIIPFVRTPINVMRFSFEFSPLAGLVGQWRGDIAAGGARQSIALARMATGVGATSIFADWAWEGHIQGPLSSKAGVREAMLRQGLQAESLRLGDSTFRLNRFEPLGMNLSVTASLAQALKSHQLEEEDFPDVEQIAAAIAVAMSKSILDKTALTAVSELVQAIQYPERRGPAFLRRRVQALVPFSSAIRSVNQVITPERAAVADMGDALQEMVIGLEDGLSRSITLWGEFIVRDVVDVVNPFTKRTVEESPIDKEIVANQIDLQRISRVTSFNGVTVNFRDFKNVFEAYQVLAGKGIRINGKNLKQTEDALVTSKGYQRFSRGTDGRRAMEIRRVVRLFRQRAQQEIMKSRKPEFNTEEFMRFRAHVKQRRQERRSLLTPSARNIQ